MKFRYPQIVTNTYTYPFFLLSRTNPEASRQIYLWRWSNIYITQEMERNRNFISLKIRQFVSLFTSGEIVWRGENAETISVHANYFVHSSMYFFVVCGFGMKLWLLFLNVLLFSFRLHICIEFNLMMTKYVPFILQSYHLSLLLL